jgi:hypothetical protein
VCPERGNFIPQSEAEDVVYANKDSIPYFLAKAINPRKFIGKVQEKSG